MDEVAVRASLHEGGHAATAAMLRVPILGVRRSTSWEACTILDTDVDHLSTDELREEAVRRAAAIITPFVMGAAGTADDVSMFAALGQAGVSLNQAYRLALDLAATDEHLELRWLTADALMERPEWVFDKPIVGPDALRRALQQ